MYQRMEETMKKFKRATAFTLIFVFVFALFTALGLYGGSAGKISLAEASGSSGKYLVVEIVPSDSAKRFQSIVNSGKFTRTGGVEVKSYTASEIKQYWKQDTEDNKNKYEEYRNDVSNADLFVINQDGNKTSSSTVSFNYVSGSENNDLPWEEVYSIFKKIAGVTGTPARYLFDYSIYAGASSDNVKDYTAFYASNRPNEESDSYTISEESGKSSNLAKLYMMLEVLDPGTFYGLYFANSGDNFGINENNGNIVAYGMKDNNGIPSLHSVTDGGKQFKAWTVNALKPYFVMVSGNGSTLSSDIGWNSSITLTAGNTSYNASKPNNRGFSYYFSSGNLGTAFDAYKDNLNSIINSSININRRNYRILIVEPNLYGDVWNRNVAYEMIKAAYNAANPESMVGGVRVDTTSMYKFIGETGNINDLYDCIYFGNETDEQNTESNVYRDDVYTKVGKTNSDGGAKGSKYPGLDLTTTKKSQLETFQENRLVIVNKDLSLTASSNMKSYLDGNSYIVKSDDSSVSTIGNIKSLIDNKSSVKMTVYKKPAIFVSDVRFDYRHMNGLDSGNSAFGAVYQAKDSLASDQYLSSDKKLEFEFALDSSSSSAKLNFYIDSNDDARFTSGEKVVDGKDVSTLFNSSTGLYEFVYQLGSTFRGSLYWQLEVTDSSKKSAVITGCSAVKTTGTKKINILQIIPVDNVEKWAESENSGIYATNIILPMKKEIAKAKTMKWGQYSGLDTNTVRTMPTGDITDNTKLAQIDNFFDGAIEIQTKNNGVQPISKTSAATTGSPGERNSVLLSNAGMFYYFLEAQGEYDVNVLRLSTEEFTDRVNLPAGDEDRITYDSSNGKISYKDPDPNSSATEPITCDLVMIGFCRDLSPFKLSTATEETSSITEPNMVNLETKIRELDWFKWDAKQSKMLSLANQIYDYIAAVINGEEEFQGGTFDDIYQQFIIAYNDTSRNPSNEGAMLTAVQNVYNKAMDVDGYVYVEPTPDPNYVNPISIIAGYVAKNKPIFIGGGVLKQDYNDELTKALLNTLGMNKYGLYTSSKKSGAPGYTYHGYNYTFGNEGPGMMIKTNLGAMTQYPYTIPELSQAASANQPIYQLDIEGNNDISVFYSLFAGPIDFGVGGFMGYGDVTSCYYLFKKGNITFSAMGHNEGHGNYHKQKSMDITFPEAALLVNAIVATQGTDPEGHEITPTPTVALPNIIPDNPGSNVVEEPAVLIPGGTVNPSDDPSSTSGGSTEEPSDPSSTSGGSTGSSSGSSTPTSAPRTYTKSKVYLYPEYDGTKPMDTTSTSGTTTIPEPMSGNPYIYTSNNYTSNSGEDTSQTVMKFVFKGDVPGGSGTQATIKVTANGIDLELQVKKSDGSNATGNKISNGETYYVEIPLDGSFYTSHGLNTGTSDKFGMDKTENFKVVIETIPSNGTGGKGTLTDVNIVKRGVFTIN
jgi:hypothetical protein